MGGILYVIVVYSLRTVYVIAIDPVRNRGGRVGNTVVQVPNLPEFKVRRTPENWAPVQAYGRGSWLEMSPRAHPFPIDSGMARSSETHSVANSTPSITYRVDRDYVNCT